MLLSRALLYRAFLFFVLTIIAFPLTLAAQVYPDFFTPPSEQISVVLDQGISAAQVPNGYYTNPLVSVYSHEGILYYAVLSDGVNVSYSSEASSSVPEVNCNASHPSTCAASIVNFNGSIYVAYSNYADSSLVIDQASVVPGNVGYSFSNIYNDTTVSLTTSPSMVVYGGNLYIFYGTNNSNRIYYTELSSTGTWTNGVEAGGGVYDVASASQPGVAVLGSTLYVTVQGNNSSHLFYVFPTNLTTWDSPVQPSGFASAGGISMVNYRGSLVAAIQQNNSNHILYIFSSSNGTDWDLHEYSSTIEMGATPGLALYNSNVSLVFKQNNTENYLFTTQD